MALLQKLPPKPPDEGFPEAVVVETLRLFLHRPFVHPVNSILCVATAVTLFAVASPFAPNVLLGPLRHDLTAFGGRVTRGTLVLQWAVADPGSLRS